MGMNAVGYAFGYAVYVLVTLLLREVRFGYGWRTEL